MPRDMTTSAPRNFVFTDAMLRSYPSPAKGSVRITDERQRGLTLTVTSKGTMTFNVRYSRSGKRQFEKIGRYPETSIRMARTRAGEILSGIESGTRSGPCRRKASDVFEEYWRGRTTELRASTAAHHLGQWNLRIEPHIGHLQVSEVTKTDIVRMQEVWKTELRSIAMPQQIISHFFRWMVKADLISATPVPPTTVARITRDRVLSLSELRSLWAWAEMFGNGLDADMGAVMRLWLLTGLRRSEVVGAEWRELPDLTNFIPAGANADEEDFPLWRIPASRMKGKAAHAIPVTRGVAEAFDLVRRTSDRWAFPNRSLSGSSGRDWAVLIKRTPVEGLMVHDIRRSVATQWAKRLKVSDDIIGLQLAHKPTSITGTTYQLSDRIAERAAIMDQWHQLLID